ncbi:DUF5677 domain-containing protein [Nonomuraea sp. NPDC050202]|uniref:DUF5677 domain-containing protein n=1 Tax=Nonomuraea sp. NPDC050202 TaxID=3155035 RepID=UPI0033D7FD02
MTLQSDKSHNNEDNHLRATLEEVGVLLEAGDTDRILLTAAERILELIAPGLKGLGDSVAAPTIGLELILRCVGVRQIESFTSILSLVKAGHPYSAQVLLRPMCEDLIFAEWLKSLDTPVADLFIQKKAEVELARGLIAQERFFPSARQQFNRSGRSTDARRIEFFEEKLREAQQALKALGESSGWGRNDQPTIKAMAEATGSLATYNFFYHATSAAAHSSLHHMLRMVWGSSDEMTISNHNFDQYHSRFAITWGIWLLSSHLAAVETFFGDILDQLDSDRYSTWLALVIIPALEHSAPPVITRDELKWTQR